MPPDEGRDVWARRQTNVGRAVFDAENNLVFFAGGTKHSELFGGDQVLCDALA